MADVSATCLLCAELKSLAEVVDVESQIEDINNKLTRINATTYLHCVNLPKNVCKICLISLYGAYDFVLTVEKAQPSLLELDRKIKQENICDDFEATETFIEIKIEQEVDNASLRENPLENETDSPASSINARVDTSISKATIKKVSEAVKPDTDTTPKPKSCEETCKPPVTNPPSTWEDYIWKCGYCDTEFPTHGELKTHTMEFHKSCNLQRCYDCNACRGNFDQFTKHVQQQHRKYLSYSCYVCFKVLPTPKETGLHRQTHRHTNHICKGCDTMFETEIQLKDHMSKYYRNTHGNTEKTNDVTCKKCNKTFNNPQALVNHMKRYKRNRDYSCETCGKSFLNKRDLIEHGMVHSDERPFACTICTVRYKQKRHLLDHLQTHSTESQYTCDVCNRGFKLKRYFDQHKIIHTNSLPYVCKFCGQGFRFRSSMYQHVRIHTGVMPYACSECDRKFRNWPNYNKHMKTRHNMNMSKKSLKVMKEVTGSTKETVHEENEVNTQK